MGRRCTRKEPCLTPRRPQNSMRIQHAKVHNFRFSSPLSYVLDIFYTQINSRLFLRYPTHQKQKKIKLHRN